MMDEKSKSATLSGEEDNSNLIKQAELHQESDNKDEVPLSKNRLKKLHKKERWLAKRNEKRAEERQKRKDRRRAQIENGETLPPSRKKLKKNTMTDSQCKQKVTIDCSFDDLMSEKEIFNMVRQINHCYAANRRAENPLQFYVTTVENKTKARLESLEEFKNWDVNFTGKNFMDEFGKENVVYLSSESPNVLDELDETQTYVIGGLVDHNHHKGLCLKLAEEKGIKHAQLPISQYVNLKTRKILSINQVFEILLYYTESKDWEKAFCQAIPSRKGAVGKSEETSNQKEADESEAVSGSEVADDNYESTNDTKSADEQTKIDCNQTDNKIQTVTDEELVNRIDNADGKEIVNAEETVNGKDVVDIIPNMTVDSTEH